MGHSYTNRNPSPDYFAKLIRDSGIVTARVFSDINQFYLLAEPKKGSILAHLEDMEAIRRVFALLADKNVLKIIYYLYSKPIMPLTLPLISRETGLNMQDTERYMKLICDNKLAYPMTIGSVNGEIESYELCREGCLVPLLCFAEEIAKKNPFPVFSVMDRNKPLF